MTSIGGYIERSRRPGELGVHSTDHFGLVVPDLAVAQKFYESFGLDVREESNNIGLYTHGSEHRCAVISEGPAKRLNYLSFGVFEDDFERFKVHTEKLGHRLVDPPRGSNSNGLWLHDHDGLLIELRSRREDFAGYQVSECQRVLSRWHARRNRTTRNVSRSAPALGTCALLLHGHSRRDQLLRSRAGLADDGSRERWHLLFPRYSWKRPSCARVRQIERTRLASLQLGRWLD